MPQVRDYNAGELMVLIVNEEFEVRVCTVGSGLRVAVSVYRGYRHVVTAENFGYSEALRAAVQNLVDRDLLKLM
jgi:hypothetical protein